MVFYYKARPEAGDYTIFMGLDKHENEDLIKYGFPEDIWLSRFRLLPSIPDRTKTLKAEIEYVKNIWKNRKDVKVEDDDGSNSSDDDLIGDRRTLKASKVTITCPFEVDDLRVISLGKIVTDSEFFQDDKDIWPEGYAAERKFTSAIDPTVKSCYTMEVIRDPDSKFRPLFRVTMDGIEQVFLMDPWWNPAVERQAQDRIHRIGQYKPIRITRFIIKNTIEEEGASI